MSKLLKKISRSTVFGDKGDVLELVMKDRAKDHPLYSVGGVVTQIERVQSRFKPDADDDFTDGSPKERRAEFKLIGDFKAINLQTGEIFRSPVCWLPAFAAQLIVGKFREGDTLEFALQIGATWNEDAVTSYEFTVTPLITGEDTPEMARIDNLLSKQAKALEAPKTADKPKA